METIYISIAAKGTMESLNSAARGKGEVVLSFYGPKGGSRACETLTLESAATLRSSSKGSRSITPARPSTL
ncbi:hypothetical protein P9228_05965 [Mesorhizobium sp. WSM4898]|uniref:hypothetical protein n=1 Tax=Mesorhizobium sp. WSM4898 TaxID=3038544 RepID=UPI002414D88F|nr:hypothetical protein [Mesorhizobium sp. WSM4898]MDG4905993.1 hypothetical protein [Mesorhizobium sp. WSM4898]